ncbi:MAG: N-acetylmuramoyl-L-alanine amidase [Oscillochloridaceae bacterium umkhey_bin13]
MKQRTLTPITILLLVCAIIASTLAPPEVQANPPAPPTPEAGPAELTPLHDDPTMPMIIVADESGDLLAMIEAQLEQAVQQVLNESGDGVVLQRLHFDGRVLTLDLGSAARALRDTGNFAALMEELDAAVSAVLLVTPLGLEQGIEYHFLIDGEPLTVAEEPLPPNDRLDPAAINGKRIVINPGHGWFLDGSTWRLQRGSWWGIIEDFINAEFAIGIRDQLSRVGADVRSTRELNKAAGTHAASGKPLWQVGAAAYTRQIGAPASVYAGSNGPLNHDLMARPYYANWVGSNAMISIHNNGGQGCGTETWYDTSNAYANQSRDLAQRIQNKIIERVRAQWNTNWCNRGIKGSNGGYGEIRAVNAPAVLIEVGFMDSYNDNQALQNATFRAIVNQAISDAVIEYFGGVQVHCPVGSYRAEYFANPSLSGTPTFVRCESSINYNWGLGGPGNGIPVDNFSVRWRGNITFTAGTYAFVATADDGVRLSVNGLRLINAWRDQPATQYRATRGLGTGTHEILLEYYERGHAATARLFWSNNLALQSPAFATSQQDANLHPARGNDGNANTRWSSRQSAWLGTEWWWTDLQAAQPITEVRITWEAAYAADHCIGWWVDGQTQATIRCYTISAPGRYTYAIGTQTARYVGVMMRKRAPWMLNYSLWEFGAYRWGGVLAANSETEEWLAAQAQAIPDDLVVVPTQSQQRVYIPLVTR